jgi:hypothetical protein
MHKMVQVKSLPPFAILIYSITFQNELYSFSGNRIVPNFTYPDTIRKGPLSIYEFLSYLTALLQLYVKLRQTEQIHNEWQASEILNRTAVAYFKIVQFSQRLKRST